MEQPECCVANPIPTADSSEHDGGLAENDEQDVGHVEADGRVSGDSEKSLHAAMMRRPALLFPNDPAMREKFYRDPSGV